MESGWQTKLLSITNLHLDIKNPRIGRETSSRAPRDIVQYLFEHDKVLEIAQSIVTRGYFPNEPLLAIKENGRYVVVEGNRRLAALKALREPALLKGTLERKVERLSRRIADPRAIAKVPVTIAPSRRATDRQIAGRHVGTPVLAWQAENRAHFILDKLDEGYSNDEIRDELGFSLADIQKARQTRAIADMARSMELSEEVKKKLANPRAKLFTTIERVFESSVGRDYLKVVPDAEHGLRGITTKNEFLKGFKKLVTDVATGEQSSRSLNTNDDIKSYFDSWDKKDRPMNKRGAFVPSDVIQNKQSSLEINEPEKPAIDARSKQISKTVLPRNFKVRFGGDRLVDIRKELTRLRREDFPNAGAVLLRVFFELSVLDYLERTGELKRIIAELKAKNVLSYNVPTMKQLVPHIIRIAKKSLSKSDALKVEKAIKYDPSAPFTLSNLHAFVHQASDLPSERDIWQFWLRTEPLFRLMLEQKSEDLGA